MSGAIELTEVGKRIGLRWVLARINLSVRRGESIALFGKNGSGKSTLLKMIATLVAPTTGTLQVLGYDAGRQKREIRKGVRLLAHEKQLYPLLTVAENLKLAARLRGTDGREIDRLIERLGLVSFKKMRVEQLSEGWKKRTVLARLLIGLEAAELILLDEPHPTLDTDGRRILEALIREWRQNGKTLVISSHDHAEVLPFVDRTVILENGRLS